MTFGMICAGWRSVRTTERLRDLENLVNRARHALTGSSSSSSVSSSSSAAPSSEVPGLGEKDVVERRLVHLDLGHVQAGGVERADDVGEVGLLLAADGDRQRVADGRRAEVA